MPEIETRRADLKALRGLHLWHAAFSNCSQRVRLILEEKGLEWTSHLIDLRAFEHATPDYQSIHPKGLVPALVHDGRTFIDSNDIIVHLNAAFPDPPIDAGDGRDLAALFALADDMQLSLRTLSHELLLGDLRRLDPDTLARFGRDHSNREFYAFLHRYSTTGFDDEHLKGCIAQIEAALGELSSRLAATKHLAGPDVSLADFSWVVNVHRLNLMSYPLAQHGPITGWFEAMQARPSYARALVAYETSVPIPTPLLLERRTRLFKALT